VFSNAGGAGGIDFSPFFGGVVASVIVARIDAGSLGSSLFAGSFGATQTLPSPRLVLITSTTQGESPIVSKAVVRIDVDENKSTVVKSWRNQ
jgi:hypothetical protein